MAVPRSTATFATCGEVRKVTTNVSISAIVLKTRGPESDNIPADNRLLSVR